MNDEPLSPARDAAVLSQALRLIRKHRHMTPKETALAMSMAPRTYQRFEAGDTRINLDHIHRFAHATRSDPQAILMAVSIGSPEHALRSCDNQLGTVVTVAIKTLDDVLGDRLGDLETRTIIAAALTFIDTLLVSREPSDPARTWFDEATLDLSTRRPRPGR